MASAVPAHECEQLFDIARTHIDDHVRGRLQIFLQQRELPTPDRHWIALDGIDTLHGNDLAIGDARGEQVACHRALADIAREIDDGEFHGESLGRSSGLLWWVLKKTSAMS